MLLCLSKAAFGKVEFNALFTFLGYFAYTLAAIRILKDRLSLRWILLLLFGSMLLMQAYSIYLYFAGTVAFLPLQLIYCLGILSAAFFYKFRSVYKFLPVALSLAFVMFMFFSGWEYWFHFANFGTFTGRVSYSLPTKFEAFDEQELLITDDDFRGKIVLVDYWYTKCGVCFNRFPHVEAAYKKYKGDSSVSIYAVDKPIAEDKPGEAFRVIKEEGYSFPVLIAVDEDIPEKWGVTGYPTTFVIDRAGVVVFKGDIEGAIRTVDQLKENN
jgi:thiol-disulfide isomerase/thioredoxin